MDRWQRLVLLDDAKLSHVDIAVMNYACANDLTGFGVTEVEGDLHTIREFAAKVQSMTARVFGQFQARPAEFHNSLAYFRSLVLITVLQRDCGIQYDPAKIPEDAPFMPGDSFLFGRIRTKLGTCANIPVLYVAVGRRLGYPLKLVAAKGANATHLFARWDDSHGERFNIEATDKGLRCPPDDYYRTGRYTLFPDEERKGNFLKSMTSREELASFLAERFFGWYDHRIYRRAVEAMAWASSLSQDNAYYLNRLKATLNEWRLSLEDRKPQRFPAIVILGGPRRFPASFPIDLERHVLGLEAMENMLGDKEQDRQWWQPMRERKPLVIAPSQAYVDFAADGCRIQFQMTTLSSHSYINQKSAFEARKG